MTGPELTNASVHAAGGYGPPGGGGGWGPPPGGGAPPGGYGGPPQGGPPPGGYGGPPQGGGYGVPPAGGFGGGGFGGGGGGGFGPPGGGFAPPGGPMGPGMGDDINTTLPLILSIISLACCWGGFGLSFILGVVGLIFSIQAGNAKKTGDMETARNKSKTALILAIIGMALGLVGSSIYSFLQYGR